MSYLDVPTDRPSPDRRASHATTISDVSDTDDRQDESNGLLRRNVSNLSTISSTFSTSSPISLRQRLRNLYYQNYGALLVLLAQVFGSAMNISATMLEKPGAHGVPMHPFQILFVRQTLTALLCTTYALVTKSIPDFPLGPPDRKVRWLLASRGVCGFFGVFGMYFSLLYLPLSEATVLTFLAPILTCYICSLVLPGEVFTRQQLMAGIVSLVGVIFIAHPTTIFSSSSLPSAVPGIDANSTAGNATTPLDSGSAQNRDSREPTPAQHLLAIGIAMIGVAGSTGAMTSIRSIGTRAHAIISINYFSVLGAVVSLIALIVLPGVSFRLPGNIIEWGLLLCLGTSGFILQTLLTMGLAYGGPANGAKQEVSPTNNQDIIVNQAHLSNKAGAEDIEMQTRTISPLPTSSSTHLSDLNASTQGPLRSRSRSRSHSRPRLSKSATKAHPSGNRATSMVYCQMLFALAADRLIFGTTLGVYSWIGSGLILSGAIWVAAAKDGSKTKVKKHHHIDNRAGHHTHPHPRTNETTARKQKHSSISLHPSRPSISRRESIPDGDGLVPTRTLSRETHGGILGLARTGLLNPDPISSIRVEESVELLDGRVHEDEYNDERSGGSGSSSSSSSPGSSSSNININTHRTDPTASPRTPS